MSATISHTCEVCGDTVVRCIDDAYWGTAAPARYPEGWYLADGQAVCQKDACQATLKASEGYLDGPDTHDTLVGLA